MYQQTAAKEIIEKMDLLEFDEEKNLTILNDGLSQVSLDEQGIVRYEVASQLASLQPNDKISDEMINLLVLITE